MMLQSAIQAYGEPSWGVSLQSLTSVDPSSDVTPKAKCKKTLGSLCLDNTSLSVAAAEVIMALGCLFVVVLIAIPCVWLEWHRKTGQVSFGPAYTAVPKRLDVLQDCKMSGHTIGT